MPLVRFAGSYGDFIAGRTVSEAVHREDGTDGVVGFVDDVRDDDEEITANDHAAEAGLIRDYNAALVPSEPPPSPPALAERLAGITSVAALRQALVDHFEPTALVRNPPDPEGGPAR